MFLVYIQITEKRLDYTVIILYPKRYIPDTELLLTYSV